MTRTAPRPAPPPPARPARAAWRQLAASAPLVIALASPLASPLAAQGPRVIDLVAGATRSGTKVVEIVRTRRGVETRISVSVGIAKGMTEKEVADAIAKAINHEIEDRNLTGIKALVNDHGDGQASVTVTDAERINVSTDDGQKDTEMELAPFVAPRAGAGFDFLPGAPPPQLAGVDPDGGVASYAIAFGFLSPTLGEISLSSTLLYTDLVTPTLDGVLFELYGALRHQLFLRAPSLLGSLTLDVFHRRIDFAPPGLFTSASVTQGTTDVSLASTGEIAGSLAPEPASVVLLATGGALLAVVWRRRARRA